MSQITFQYKALSRDGSTTKGVVSAFSQNDAYRQLNAKGLRPVRIAAARAGRKGKRVTTKDLAHLTHQFAVLMEARIPIVDGLRSIAEQENNPRLTDTIMDVAAEIESGSNVTDALAKHREMFGDVYVETVRAAEASGNMIEVLQQLSEMLERQYEINKSVKAALMYPICVVSALSLAVVFLIIFVVPRFGEMFAARGIDLPLPTQILITFSGFIRAYWMFILVGLGGGFWAIRTGWRKPHTRRKMDTALHRVPFIKHVLKGLAISRFAHVFGITLRSGLSLLDALEMAGRASARPLLDADAKKLRDQVKSGGRLSDVLNGCQYLPPFTRRMLAAGEEAADLPRMCEIVGSHYDREVGYLTKNVATIIEPIMIVGLSGVVLIVALAIFLPMWNMGALI